MSEPPFDRQRPDSRVEGAAMIAMGTAIIGLCGTCTAAFDGKIVWQMMRTGYDEGGLGALMLFMSIAVGGAPILVGALFVRSGLKRYRETRPKPPPSVPPPG